MKSFSCTSIDKYELGRELCREGVPHSDKWPELVTEGYAYQYQLEQAEKDNEAL